MCSLHYITLHYITLHVGEFKFMALTILSWIDVNVKCQLTVLFIEAVLNIFFFIPVHHHISTNLQLAFLCISQSILLCEKRLKSRTPTHESIINMSCPYKMVFDKYYVNNQMLQSRFQQKRLFFSFSFIYYNL